MKTQTPEWLLQGAFNVWCSENPKQQIRNTLIPGCLVAMVLLFVWVFQPYYLSFPGQESDLFMFLGSLMWLALIFWTMYLIYRVSMKKMKMKYGTKKEWQQKYLRSKIKETVDYESRMEKVITAIQKDAADEARQIKENLKSMLEKKTQAEEWLLNLG